MKKDKTKKYKNNKNNLKKSSSRYKEKKTRKSEIKIKTLNKSQRARKRKLAKKRTYMKRRLMLLLIALIVTFLTGKSVYKMFNSYKNYNYPSFRDNFLETISSKVFIGNNDDRTLTSAEKLSDFEQLNEIVSRNFAIDNENEDNFKNFIKSYDDYKQKVKKSKTDQEFYDIIDSFISIIDDNRTKLIDRKNYYNLFSYYKEDSKSQRAKVLGDSQVVNRYKRILGKKIILEPAEIKENNKILELKFSDFNLETIKEDKEKIKNILMKNSNINSIIIDLSNNDSMDDKYANQLLPLFIHNDYTNEKVIFYRGNLLKESLAFSKENKDENFVNIYSSYMKNQSSKYPEDIEEINKDYYMYYDTITSQINKDKDISNKNIYILTNENTKNDAIRFSNILKKASNAYIIKNGLVSENTKEDKIYKLRADIFKLDHSGLIISINNSFEYDKEENYLEYDQKINTDNPKKYIYEHMK